MPDTETYFTHVIDKSTYYCIGCGALLSTLQEKRNWRGNAPTPVCAQVTGISHLVRKPA